MLNNIKRFIKQMRCKHSHTWDFYPTESNYNGSVMKGHIKITMCWKCGSVIDIKNFGQ